MTEPRKVIGYTIEIREIKEREDDKYDQGDKIYEQKIMEEINLLRVIDAFNSVSRVMQ